MKEPVLVVMAAGLGSRYGGLKQMEPMGSNGELIIDFSLYDAFRAGFRKAVFIIKKETYEDFRALIESGAGKKMEAVYAFQDLEDLPSGFSVPEGRVKPWGTAHAVLAARAEIDAPFAVINADDFYGPGAFQKMYDFLAASREAEPYRYAMAGYLIENTLTENGHVARGVCEVDESGYLKVISERTKIQRNQGTIQYTEDDKVWNDIAEGTLVSMNFWGFTPAIVTDLSRMLPEFLEKTLQENPLKGEFYLPISVDQLIKEKRAGVKVLPSEDRWYGVTYKEDRQGVVEALEKLKADGVYPEKLWG